MTERLERKDIQVVTADIKAARNANGSYDITLSVPTEDRDGEIIDAKALYWVSKGRMPIDVDHGMTVLTTVGSGLPVYDGDDLKLADFRFASTLLAQDVKTLVDEEHISKMSVAFMAAKRVVDKAGRPHVVKAELLNAAIVAIPSNREADIAFAAKSYLRQTDVRRVLAEAEQLLIELALEDARSVLAATAPEPPLAFWRGGGDLTSQVNAFLRSM